MFSAGGIIQPNKDLHRWASWSSCVRFKALCFLKACFQDSLLHKTGLFYSTGISFFHLKVKYFHFWVDVCIFSSSCVKKWMKGHNKWCSPLTFKSFPRFTSAADETHDFLSHENLIWQITSSSSDSSIFNILSVLRLYLLRHLSSLMWWCSAIKLTLTYSYGSTRYCPGQRHFWFKVNHSGRKYIYIQIKQMISEASNVRYK